MNSLFFKISPLFFQVLSTPAAPLQDSIPLSLAAMSRHYSRSEKEKWPIGSSKPRRSPLRIPDGDNSALIAENRLSLIGRVTNPSIQRSRAVVEFMPQYWNLEGRIRGRDLGPDLFQFFFESESDLLSVLNKSPYHFKQWMLILQRWEPIVSDSFPSQISFWVRIIGIPTHFRSDQTIRTIGKELGHLSARDVEQARVRVEINGLQPLETNLEVRLPSGQLKTVEFEYERLEKHCFLCLSLSHEKKDCPHSSSADPKYLRPMGINQRKALLRLDSERRRNEDKKRGRSDDDDSRPTKRPNHTNSEARSSPSRSRHSDFKPSSSFNRRIPSRNNSRDRDSHRPSASHGRSPPLPASRNRALPDAVRNSYHSSSHYRPLPRSSASQRNDGSRHGTSPRHFSNNHRDSPRGSGFQSQEAIRSSPREEITKTLNPLHPPLSGHSHGSHTPQ